MRERDKESGSADQRCTWAHHGHDISTQGPQPEPCCSLINIHFIQFIYFRYSKLNINKIFKDQDAGRDNPQMIFNVCMTLDCCHRWHGGSLICSRSTIITTHWSQAADNLQEILLLTSCLQISFNPSFNSAVDSVLTQQHWFLVWDVDATIVFWPNRIYGNIKHIRILFISFWLTIDKWSDERLFKDCNVILGKCGTIFGTCFYIRQWRYCCPSAPASAE